jgi:hypothetical protein
VDCVELPSRRREVEILLDANLRKLAEIDAGLDCDVEPGTPVGRCLVADRKELLRR